MNRELFQEVAHWIDAGAAPGCAITLSSSDRAQQESFAYGYFASPDSATVTTDTVYDLASVSKLFTTALILRLHEQGRLSVHDRCASYLPNFRHSGLRIIDLLTHHVDFGIALSAYRTRFTDAKELRDALLRLEPPLAAGNATTYANLQFLYLGIIVERVTGLTLQDAMHKLCQALSLKYIYTGEDVARLGIATPPTEVVDGQPVSGVTHDETARMLGGLTGHAGVFANATDLAQFGRAWLDGRIVNLGLMNELVLKDYDTNGSGPQALGWWLRLTGPDGPYPTPGIYSHTGFTGSLLAISPRTGNVCAFTCNRTYYGRDNTKQRHIWQLLIEWAQTQPVAVLHG